MPKDDGACDHLADATVPDLSLMVARDPSNTVNLSKQPGLTIAFLYPRTGKCVHGFGPTRFLIQRSCPR